jgi:exodeoxyribonuclease VII small subunit
MAEKSYKQLESELHELLDRVEHDSYDELDNLLKDYDKGTKLIADLQSRLEKAKNSVVKVKSATKES